MAVVVTFAPFACRPAGRWYPCRLRPAGGPLALVLALLAVLPGCPPADPGLDDRDGDGWVPPQDCDDRDPLRSPGAIEVCNQIDDDCDGVVDDDLPLTYHPDADQDRYGDPDMEVTACNQPAGYTTDASDCDDTNAEVHPAGAEVCDGLDNDCDGVVDGGLDVVYHADTDGDGWGDPDRTVASCEPPSGWVLDATDCDDTDPDTHPTATEACDEEDDDCDGAVDEYVRSPFYRDFDGDGFGDAGRTEEACRAPTGYTADATDCDDASALNHPGADENCDLADNDCDGTVDEGVTTAFYADADRDGYGDPAAWTEACTRPSGTVEDASDCDDTRSTVHPLATEICGNGLDDSCADGVDDGCPVEHCGAISASETWSASFAHVVTCDVLVEGAGTPVLTVEDGAAVTFAPGTGITVGVGGPGTLRVQGTSLGVVFSGEAGGASPDPWDGLAFGSEDGGSTLDGLLLEGGGAGGDGAVVIAGGTVTVSRSVLSGSAARGVYVPGGTLALSDTEIGGSALECLRVEPEAALSTGFSGNALLDCGAVPLALPPDAMGALAPFTTSGTGAEVIEVSGGTVRQDATWADLSLPWWITGPVLVEGPAAPQVVVEDGNTFAFEPGAGIEVGGSDAGALLVVGVLRGVSMGSAAAVPAPGDWSGLAFGPFADGSRSGLTGLSLTHAGAGDGALVLSGPRLAVASSTVSGSASDGIVVDDGVLDLVACTVEGNAGSGLHLGPDADLGFFTANILTGNGAAPVVLPAEAVGTLDVLSSYTGNALDRLTILGGTVASDATWRRLDVPYLVEADVTVEGSRAPLLEIEAGSVLTFAAGASLAVGVSEEGALGIGATPADPVTFSSSQATPAPGDWAGLWLGPACDPALTRLVGVVVSYGGGNGYGNVVFDGCDGGLGSATIASSAHWGIYRVDATPVLVDVTYTGNLAGDLC